MEPKILCDRLLLAEDEETIVQTLSNASYWDDESAWRPYGDLDNNYGTIGNQQSEAVAALVEKIVNAIDARLMNACLAAGENPESPDAPNSMREAVHRYFEGRGAFDPDRSGRLSNWTGSRLNVEGDKITVVATGARPDRGRGSRSARPSLTISDGGEGQTPDEFPSTFLSLHRNNKIRTRFVQGKFNMGATGALPYCSEKHNFQLIISRRNPALLPVGSRERDGQWGFTIVRRRDPSSDSRSSVFQYLAPVKSGNGDWGNVLSFSAPSYPIFPDRTGAYARQADYGSLIKLYGYRWQGTSSSIIMPGDGSGLIRRIELALAEPALPVKLYENREYTANENFRGVRGILTDLERNRTDLEDGFPISADLGIGSRQIGGRSHQVQVRAFVFKAGAYRSHRTARYGVLFLYNGQLHASYSTRFFTRQSVRKNYLAEDLLVTVDCSEVDRRDFEELFMNSRDRLRGDSNLATDLERKIEQFLRNSDELNSLNRFRRDSAIAQQYDEDALRTDLLRDILQNNPDISRYLLDGANIVRPGRGPLRDQEGQFEGKQFPTYFRARRKEWGVGAGRTVRIEFETDVENHYFDRTVSPGSWSVTDETGASWTNHWDRTGPNNGIARFSWDTGALPPGFIKPGMSFELCFNVQDESRVEPLEETIRVNVIEPIDGSGGGSRTRPGRGAEGIQSPNISEVREEEWQTHPLGPFDSKTAVKVAQDPSAASNREAWDFYVNVDNENIHLYAGRNNQPIEAVRKDFTTAMVFLSLAIIRGASLSDAAGPGVSVNGMVEGSEAVPDLVAKITSYVGPVLMPVISALGANRATDPLD